MTAWDLARPDWQERIRQGRSLLPDLPLLDRARADRAIGVYRNLKIPDVPGTPTFGTAGGPWFEEIVGAVHGSWDPAAGERHIREVFLLVPKKNAKTTKGAGLMFTTLLLNERPRAEFLLVAPTQQVALLAFGQLTGMIEGLGERFRQRFHIQDHLKKVTELGSDAEAVADLIARVDARGLLFKVGLDPIGIAEIVDALEVRGIGEDRRIGISQGWKLAGAIKDAERALAAGRLRHCGRPMMAWAVGNAKTVPMGNAVMITKQVAGSAKIDPLMAVFNATALMVMNPAAMGGPSVYETQDLKLLDRSKTACGARAVRWIEDVRRVFAR